MSISIHSLSILLLTATAFAMPGLEVQRFPLGHVGLKSVRSVVELKGGELVVVDPIGGRVVSITLPDSQGKQVSWKEWTSEDLAPTVVARANAGYVQIVQSERGKGLQSIHWLDSDLESRGMSAFKPTFMPDEDVVLGVYDYTVAGDRLFAYGALSSGARAPEDLYKEFKMGFFTVHLRSPGDTVKGDLVETFSEWDFYTMGAPYVTSIGHDVYYLEMSVYPSLKHFNAREGGRPVGLHGLPGGDLLLPSVNANTSSHDLFALIEALAIPVGLYADDLGGDLYLLRRSPSGGGLTDWIMTQLHPMPWEGRVADLGTVTLPTAASHLTVLFTRESVLVFEKSSVRGDRTQSVEEVVVIPRVWVTGLAESPLWR